MITTTSSNEKETPHTDTPILNSPSFDGDTDKGLYSTPGVVLPGGFQGSGAIGEPPLDHTTMLSFPNDTADVLTRGSLFDANAGVTTPIAPKRPLTEQQNTVPVSRLSKIV